MSAQATLTTRLQPATGSPDGAARKALRFLTAGSVDDGKSTLIGRLLLDSRAILADQMAHLEGKAAGRAIDLSLLTDGLEAEREQGITIDVAYRYFATRRRKFVIADAPGHEQYTRNMVTAAAGSDAAVVLVDITKIDWRAPTVALLPQTRRHTLLAQLLRVPSIVFAINKLDAVDQPALACARVAQALRDFAQEAGITPAGIVPVSALRGDNVTSTAPDGWYQGPSLLQVLEALPSATDDGPAAMAMPVQYVARVKTEDEESANPQRIFWGRLASASVRAGDTVTVFPSGQQAVVVEVLRAGQTVSSAQAGESAGLVLDRPLDISRGNWLLGPGSTIQPAQRFTATLSWLDTQPAQVGRKYWVRHANQWAQARIAEITSRLDIHTLQPTDAHSLDANEMGQVVVELQQPLPLQAFRSNRVGGALIVVDPTSNRTSGALLVS
jgi:sulfate adenylyltransferase subunit 1